MNLGLWQRVLPAQRKILSGLLKALALAALALFIAYPFRAGWMRSATDFPNYYTAAVLVRQSQPLRNYYDWTWFVRQMNYAGLERQLGAFILYKLH